MRIFSSLSLARVLLFYFLADKNIFSLIDDTNGLLREGKIRYLSIQASKSEMILLLLLAEVFKPSDALLIRNELIRYAWHSVYFGRLENQVSAAQLDD